MAGPTRVTNQRSRGVQIKKPTHVAPLIRYAFHKVAPFIMAHVSQISVALLFDSVVQLRPGCLSFLDSEKVAPRLHLASFSMERRFLIICTILVGLIGTPQSN